MSLIDWLIIAVILIFVIDSFGKSFFSEIIDFVSFFTAFIFSLRFYNFFAYILQNNFNIAHSLANVLGFIISWFLMESILFALIKILLTKKKELEILKKYHLTKLVTKNLKYFSFIPAFLRGVIFVSILLILLGIFPIQPRLKNAINESLIANFLLQNTQNFESPLKNVFGGISQDTLTFLTVKPQKDERINLGFVTSDFLPDSILEYRMINLVNHEREKRGLSTLIYDQRLTEIARSHSEDMFLRGYFSHYSPENKTVADRAASFRIKYSVIGENLAYAPTLELAHTGLMNSEGHRANILSEDFGKIGIGIMNSPTYGLMVTQVFTDSAI